MPCNRKAEYRLYPKPEQVKDLERICRVAGECYNLALAERKYLYHEWGISMGFSQQCAHIKLWPIRGLADHGKRFDEELQRLCSFKTYRKLL